MHAPQQRPHRVLKLNNIDAAGINVLTAACDVGTDIADPEGIIVRNARVDTDNYPYLLAVARAGAGLDKITVDKATARGIPVFFARGANANSVNELFYTLVGGLLRNVFDAMDFVKRLDPNMSNEQIEQQVEELKKQFVGSEFSEKTVGLAGMGNIGRIIANGALDRGMRVCAFDPHLPDAEWAEMDLGIRRVQTLPDLCRKADIVSVHVDLNGSTHNLIDASLIECMKDGAVLANLARAEVCNEDAVLRALRSNKLRGLATDFPTSGIVRYLNDDELSDPKKHGRIVCTPHLGASTNEAEERSAVMAAKHLLEYLRYGIVVNAKNFPTLEVHPDSCVRMRLTIPHKNVPDMLGTISHTIGKQGINIQFSETKTKGQIGYMIVDLETPMDDAQVSMIRGLDNVLPTMRVLRFD